VSLPALLLAVTAAVAVLDWVAVGTGRVRLEAVAKPAVMLGLLALALALGSTDPAPAARGGTRLSDLSADGRPGTLLTALVLAALLAGLAGDVLLLPQVDRFVPGLVAFLLGHLGYSVAFAGHGLRPGATLVGAGVAAGLVLAAGVPILRAVRRHRPALGLPVACYLAVTGLVAQCSPCAANVA